MGRIGGESSLSLVPVKKDAEAGGTYLLTLARVHAHFGNANDAVPLLQQLIRHADGRARARYSAP
jgi:hypothetical protein